MTETLRHRGPDDEGEYVSSDGRCALGNRRLAIIDRSAAGHMPMGSPDGRFWITYNGELYNFRALRAELESRGHRFRSSTDTEVLLHMYIEYGPECVPRLNGMFAFAIWDATQRELFLGRDRLGIKPLYYTQTDDSLAFASEIRALLTSGFLRPVADPLALAGYLAFGSVPDNGSIITGVRSLLPAHTAVYRDSCLTVRRYWDHAEEMRRAPLLPASDAHAIVRECLKDAVARQSFSDAPLGLFLSSGLDSTMLAALMTATGSNQIRSVSISFDRPDFDESANASGYARRFGLNHTNYRVTDEDVAVEIDRVIDHMDQPSNDAINTYFVSKAARACGLTVTLSGLGADELFGGYPTFTTLGRVRRYLSQSRRLPAREALATVAAGSRFLPHRAQKLAAWSDSTATTEGAYRTIRGSISQRQSQQIAPALPTFDGEEYLRERVHTGGFNDFESASLLESRIYMHNQLLRDTDSMSMAHSLEVRVPYLDNEVIAVAAAARKLMLRADKATLAGARSLYFPIGLRLQPKQGFIFPLGVWMNSALKPFIDDTIASPRIFSPPALRSCWERFQAGQTHWAQMWTMIVLERWLDRHHVAVR
jgi:asparagine synthase (glutamine-hydrolysing)